MRGLFLAVDALPALILISFLPAITRTPISQHAGVTDRYALGCVPTRMRALSGAPPLIHVCPPSLPVLSLALVDWLAGCFLTIIPVVL